MPTDGVVPATELDAFASHHLLYEVTRLIDYAGLLRERYPNGIPDRGFDCPADDALLEALLVHVRLLDEFLAGRRSHRCDAKPTDWAPTWTCEPLLSDRDRVLINRRVAHLSLCREETRPWDIDDLVGMTGRCCTLLAAFINAVKPRRRAAFTKVRDLVEQELDRCPA